MFVHSILRELLRFQSPTSGRHYGADELACLESFAGKSSFGTRKGSLRRETFYCGHLIEI